MTSLRRLRFITLSATRRPHARPGGTYRLKLGFAQWVVPVAFAAMLAGSEAANAYVIGFDSLVGLNGVPYAGHTEGGFAVTPTSGVWFEAHIFGNPVPDIFSRSNTGVINVTGGLFTFAGVDLGDGSVQGGTAFAIKGFLGGMQALSQTGMNLPGGVFTTINSSNTVKILDRLEITMFLNSSTSYNIDNIVVNAAAVPAPGTMALVGIGLAGLGFSRRKRARAIDPAQR